jgi:hypothetical protein
VGGEVLDLGVFQLGRDRVHERVRPRALTEGLELPFEVWRLLRRQIGDLARDADAGLAVAPGALLRLLAAGLGIGGQDWGREQRRGHKRGDSEHEVASAGHLPFSQRALYLLRASLCQSS